MTHPEPQSAGTAARPAAAGPDQLAPLAAVPPEVSASAPPPPDASTTAQPAPPPDSQPAPPPLHPSSPFPATAHSRSAVAEGASRFTAAEAQARLAAASVEAQARLSAAAHRPPPPDPINDPVNRVSDWNIANALTLLRILLVPVFAVVLFTDGGHHTGWRVAAFGVFAIASITDRIDGEVARRRHLVTELGKLADPIADKALIGTALVGLSALRELPWWVTVVVLARELGVTALRFWVIRLGVMAASRGGKVKTLLQGVAIGLYVLPLSGWVHDVAAVVMGAAVLLTLITGADYVSRALSLRRRRAADPGSQVQRADQPAQVRRAG